MSVEGERRKERLQGDGGRGQACDIWPSCKHGPPEFKIVVWSFVSPNAKKNNKGCEQVPEVTARETRMGRQSQVILPILLC